MSAAYYQQLNIRRLFMKFCVGLLYKSCEMSVILVKNGLVTNINHFLPLIPGLLSDSGINSS